MKKTILVKHSIDYSADLEKARQIAEWAVQNKYQVSSKHVKHIGLSSAIANQVLKKYGMNRAVKEVKHVKLTIPRNGDGIRVMEPHRIYVACIKANISCWFDLSGVEKIDQIEVDNRFYYITFDVPEVSQYQPTGFIGIDLNATEHSAVIAVNDKIIKRGKQAPHIKRTYAATRKRLRRKKQHATLKRINNREARRTRDLNHKLSREVVDLAKSNHMGIRMENLSHIRERTNTKSSRKSRGITNNWNFYQLRQMMEYKSRICGVPIEFINPAYTSKTCSRCGLIGTRSKKTFQCDSCGHADHADANAAFNIASAMLVAHISKEPDMKAEREPAEAATPSKQRSLEAARSLASR